MARVGAKRDPNIVPGSREARGRTVVDTPTTRGEQVLALSRQTGINFGVRLEAFNDRTAGEFGRELTPVETVILGLLHRYCHVIHVAGNPKAVVKPSRVIEPRFTSREIAGIRRGIVPV